MMVFVMSDCIYSNMGGTAVKVDLSSLKSERISGTFVLYKTKVICTARGKENKKERTKK